MRIIGVTDSISNIVRYACECEEWEIKYLSSLLCIAYSKVNITSTDDIPVWFIMRGHMWEESIILDVLEDD